MRMWPDSLPRFVWETSAQTWAPVISRQHPSCAAKGVASRLGRGTWAWTWRAWMPTSVKINCVVESRWSTEDCLWLSKSGKLFSFRCAYESSASKCCLTESYDQYGIAQQFAISRVSYVPEWMLFGSNKFSGMTVKEGLSCLLSGIVFSFVCHSSRVCTVNGWSFPYYAVVTALLTVKTFDPPFLLLDRLTKLQKGSWPLAVLHFIH